MAFKFGFYNSMNGDRVYDAVDMSSMFDGILEDGIIKTFGGAFAVTSNGSNSVSVASGRAWFKHTWNYNETSTTLTLPSPNVSQPRYDAVIIRVDTSSRKNTLMVVSGNASSSPSKPRMTHTGSINDYPLAYIRRSRNSSSTTSIEDARGTRETPWLKSVIGEDSVLHSPLNRNQLMRGKNLGKSITSDQINAIRNWTLDDMYIGDYWELGGKTWYIAKFFNTHKAVGLWHRDQLFISHRDEPSALSAIEKVRTESVHPARQYAKQLTYSVPNGAYKTGENWFHRSDVTTASFTLLPPAAFGFTNAIGSDSIYQRNSNEFSDIPLFRLGGNQYMSATTSGTQITATTAIVDGKTDRVCIVTKNDNYVEIDVMSQSGQVGMRPMYFIG